MPPSSEPSGFPPFIVKFSSVSVLPLATLKMRCVVAGAFAPSLFALSTADVAPSAFFTVRLLSITISPELSVAFVALISPFTVMTAPSPAALTASLNFFHASAGEASASIAASIKASFPCSLTPHFSLSFCVTVNLVCSLPKSAGVPPSTCVVLL